MESELDVVKVNTAMMLSGEIGDLRINGELVQPEHVRFYLCLTNKRHERYYIPMTLASLRRSFLQYTGLRSVRMDRVEECLGLPVRTGFLRFTVATADGLELRGNLDDMYSITITDDVNASTSGKVDLWRCKELADMR